MLIDDGKFDKLYCVAKEASDRTRSTLYIFLVINFGLFITVFGANIYDRPLERLKGFEKAIDCNSSPPKPANYAGSPDCRTATEYAREKGYIVDASTTNRTVDKRLESLVSEEIASKKVSIPIVGFSFDIDYLWVLTCYFGPLAMIIVLAATQNEAKIITRVLSLMTDQPKDDDLFRYMLLSSTQVLITARPTVQGKKFAEYILYISRITFLRSIFLMPVLTQSLIIYYDLGIDDLTSCALSLTYPCGAFIINVTSEFYRHFTLQIIQFLSEIFSFVLMLTLTFVFLKTTSDLRGQYTTVANKLKTRCI